MQNVNDESVNIQWTHNTKELITFVTSMTISSTKTHCKSTNPEIKNKGVVKRVIVSGSRTFFRDLYLVLYCLNLQKHLQKNLPFLKITVTLKVCNFKHAHAISGPGLFILYAQ